LATLVGLLLLLAYVGPALRSLASDHVVLVVVLPSVHSDAAMVWFSVLAGSRCCARTWAHGAVGYSAHCPVTVSTGTLWVNLWLHIWGVSEGGCRHGACWHMAGSMGTTA